MEAKNERNTDMRENHSENLITFECDFPSETLASMSNNFIYKFKYENYKNKPIYLIDYWSNKLIVLTVFRFFSRKVIIKKTIDLSKKKATKIVYAKI